MCHKLLARVVGPQPPTPSTAVSECDQMSREMLIMAAGCIVCVSVVMRVQARAAAFWPRRAHMHAGSAHGSSARSQSARSLQPSPFIVVIRRRARAAAASVSWDKIWWAGCVCAVPICMCVYCTYRARAAGHICDAHIIACSCGRWENRAGRSLNQLGVCWGESTRNLNQFVQLFRSLYLHLRSPPNWRLQ